MYGRYSKGWERMGTSSPLVAHDTAQERLLAARVLIDRASLSQPAVSELEMPSLEATFSHSFQ